MLCVVPCCVMQVQFHLELMQGVYISGRAYQNAGLVPAHTRKPFTFQVGTTTSSATRCASELEGWSSGFAVECSSGCPGLSPRELKWHVPSPFPHPTMCAVL